MNINIIDAIQIANKWVKSETDKTCYPDSVIFRNNDEKWMIVYSSQHFFPEVYAQGGVIDGGEVIVLIDSNTGQIEPSPY